MESELSTVPQLSRKQLQNIRRGLQRKRALELKNQNLLQSLQCTGEYLFYQSNHNTGVCNERKCSVCQKTTTISYPCLHGGTALCSDVCQELYNAQFLQIGITCRESRYIKINGKVYDVNLTGLQKNKDGDICLVVEDPDLDVGEYTPNYPIYFPLSQVNTIFQLPRTYIHNPY
jgi:hypothetical protein